MTVLVYATTDLANISTDGTAMSPTSSRGTLNKYKRINMPETLIIVPVTSSPVTKIPITSHANATTTNSTTTVSSTPSTSNLHRY